MGCHLPLRAFRAVRSAGPLDWEPIMFPEIARDEVFRLETRRLWLRWPTMADAFDGPEPKAMSMQRADGGLDLSGSACVACWRATNEAGRALHLTAEDKQSRTGIGSIHLGFGEDGRGLLALHLLPRHFGDGRAAEAIQAVVHSTFLIRATTLITATASSQDVCRRKTLEDCGFHLVETHTGTVAPERSIAPDRYMIRRSEWAARQGWSVPISTPSLRRFAPSPACWSMPA
jgi:hypothetical protein